MGGSLSIRAAAHAAVLVSVFLAGATTALADAVVPSRQAIKISSPDWPPFYLDGTKPGAMGFAKEVSQVCATRVGLASEFVDYFPIRRMFKEMQRGALDFNIMSFKPDRAEFLHYGKEKVFHNNYIPFVRSNAKVTLRGLKDFDKYSVGDYVGIRPSDEYRAYLDARLARPEGGGVTVVNHTDSLVKMLAKGRIDLTVTSEAEFEFRARSLGLGDRIKSAGYLIKSQDYFFVLAKQSPLVKARPRLINDLDACLVKLKASGEYAALMKQYGMR